MMTYSAGTRSYFHPLCNQAVYRHRTCLDTAAIKDISGSSAILPPAREYLGDLMHVLSERLKEEEHAAVRAVLGHFIFVYIHPYMNGNGRIGRFLMNTMMASGGYPWTIVPVMHRSRYLAALEPASAEGNILPFTEFIAAEI